MKHRFYPIALNVQGRDCVVIGSDEEVLKKATGLAEAGARVTVAGEISPPALAELETRGVRCLRRPFTVADLSDQFLAVLSFRTDDGLAADVARRCRERRILLAALDRPAICDVINLSLFDRGRLRIGISTQGASPGLARKIREGLEESLKEEPIEDFLEDLAALRERLEKEQPVFDQRKRALLAAIEGFEFRASLRFPPAWRAKGVR